MRAFQGAGAHGAAAVQCGLATHAACPACQVPFIQTPLQPTERTMMTISDVTLTLLRREKRA